MKAVAFNAALLPSVIIEYISLLVFLSSTSCYAAYHKCSVQVPLLRDRNFFRMWDGWEEVDGRR
jgi:hypothetical protein